MSRATNAPASRERRRKRLELAKGFYGGRSKRFRTATEAVDHARRYATVHRKLRKRDYRSLWIVRINAAVRPLGITYSRFIEGLNKAKVQLNRKILADLAVNDPAAFTAILEAARAALPEDVNAPKVEASA